MSNEGDTECTNGACEDQCVPGTPQEGTPVQTQSDYEFHGDDLRAKIKAVAAEVKSHIQRSKGTQIPEGVERGEMIANATLSYRHLESAAMRIGKCLQAYGGGKSILDK